MSVLTTLSYNNKVLCGFMTYSVLLVLKIILLVLLTVFWRLRKKAVANSEDAIAKIGLEVKQDENVERVRRAHQNDIENIYLFFIFGFFYVLTDPNVYVALVMFRIYFVLRFLHTIFYAIFPVPYLRTLCFVLSLSILGYFVIAVIVAFPQF